MPSRSEAFSAYPRRGPGREEGDPWGDREEARTRRCVAARRAAGAAPTDAQVRVVLHQGPAVVIHAVAAVHQQLAQVPGLHVHWNLHHFACPVLTKDFNILQQTGALTDE